MDIKTKGSIMRYYYLDETFKKLDGYWHGMVGGPIISPEQINKLNHRINDLLNDILVEDGEIKGMDEMHLNNLFPRVNDDNLKLSAISAIVDELKKANAYFLVSYAKARTCEVKKIIEFYRQDGGACIVRQAYFNIPHFLQDITNDEIVQLVIDAGFDRSYKILHGVYMGFKRSVDSTRIFKEWRGKITTPNYLNVLPPLFSVSDDERMIQVADLIVGTQMWKVQEGKSKFKEDIINIVNGLNDNVTINEIEWNRKK